MRKIARVNRDITVAHLFPECRHSKDEYLLRVVFPEGFWLVYEPQYGKNRGWVRIYPDTHPQYRGFLVLRDWLD